MQANTLRFPAVRVATNASGSKVISVAVAGRPRPHRFGGYEGSHITPWAVFVDSVRRATADSSPKAAARAVRKLLERLDTPGGDNAKLLADPWSTWFNKIIDEGWDVLEQARTTGDISDLQTGIAMYLTGRNLAPMTAAFLGEDKARGRGEPAALRKLREYESGGRAVSKKELRTLLAGLLDTDAVAFIASKGDGMTVPGILPDRKQAATKVVIWHLRELSRAYPLAYDGSGLGTTDGFNATFGKYGITVNSGIKMPETEYEWDPAPSGWSLSNSNACLANIETEIRATQPYVGELKLDGRGNTLLNTQGHHVTAHTAIEAAVYQTVVSATIANALNRMLTLTDNIKNLATYPTSDLGSDVDPKGVYRNAKAALEAAKTAAKTAQTDATDELDMVPELETLIGAYVMMRNALPMAAVLRGATADAKAEGHKMNKLWAWDEHPDTASPAEVCWTLWKLLDLQALTALGEMDDGKTQQWAPAAPATPDERVLRVLSVHLDTMSAAFPALFKLSYMRSTGAVEWVLTKECGLAVPPNAVTFLGLTNRKITPVSPFKSHLKKPDNDPDWGQGKRLGGY